MSTVTAKSNLNEREYVFAVLAEAEQEAANPNTVFLSHSDIMANAANRREARSRAYN
jgi:hypothetical protein